MRIEDSLAALKTRSVNRPFGFPPEGSAATRTAVPNDEVRFSLLALSAGGSHPKQIDQLRLEVEAGSYQVPAVEVSKKIADFYLGAH